MKKTIPYLLLLVGLALADSRGALEQHIVTRFYRVQPASLTIPVEPQVPFRPGKPGVKFCDLVDLRDCSSIETGLDEIAWPTPLVPELLLRARRVDAPRRHRLPIGALTVSWPSKRQLRIELFGDRARVGHQWFQLASPVDAPQASVLRKQVVAGKTRAEIEQVLVADGGLSRPFQLERYVLPSTQSDPRVVKVNLQFRSAGGPGDVLLRVSPPYREPPYFD